MNIDSKSDLLYSEKSGFGTVAKEAQERQKQLNAGLSMEEAELLNNYTKQVGSISGFLKGSGANIKNAAEPYKSVFQELIQLSEACKDKQKSGFRNNEERREFFINLGKSARKLTTLVDSNNGKLKETDFPDISEESWSATSQAVNKFAPLCSKKGGPVNRVAEYGERLQWMKNIRDKDWRNQLDDCYLMMRDTGSTYFGNSPQYKNMMKTLETVKKLAEKKDLNSLEEAALSASKHEIETACIKYLDRNHKLSKQLSDDGIDRFAGALGILNLVNPEKAEIIRQKASSSRKVNITMESIQQRVEKRSAEAWEKIKKSRKGRRDIIDTPSDFSHYEKLQL